MDIDVDSKDFDILIKIKDLDDKLLNFHRANIFCDSIDSMTNHKIHDIDKNIQHAHIKLNELYEQIDCIKNDISECKHDINNLLVSKENHQDPEHMQHIDENIDVLNLKIQILNRQLDDSYNSINKQQQHIQMLENDKQFFLNNNQHACEKNNIFAIISEINISKRTLLSMLSANTLKEYNDLFEIDNNKLAISNIVDGFCGGCNLLTTLQQQEEVLQHNKLVHCEYCCWCVVVGGGVCPHHY